MLKLNTKGVRDKASGLTGTLTHMEVGMNLSRHYIFQPDAINPKKGHPVQRLMVVEERLENTETIPDIPLPLEVLGTLVEDEVAGLKGMAIAVCLHPGNCIHVEIQPRGTAESNESIAPIEMDYRRLKGKAIQKEAKKKLEGQSPESLALCARERI